MSFQPIGAHDRKRRRNEAPLAVEKASVNAAVRHAKLDSEINGDTDMAGNKDTSGLISHSALPVLLSWGAVVCLIFAGCCSNVGLFPTS